MIKLTQLINELGINKPYRLCGWVDKSEIKHADWDVLRQNFDEDVADAIVIATGELNLSLKPFTKQDIEKRFREIEDLKDMWGGTIDELIQYLLKNNVICQ